MEKIAFDVRNIPVKGLLDSFVSNDSESFVYMKYTDGRPNESMEATEEGSKNSLEKMISREPEPLFGTHIRETIRQWRSLFGKN